jgi:hypothetical protein
MTLDSSNISPYLLIGSLGSWLVERGIISQDQFQVARERQLEAVKKLGRYPPLSELLVELRATSASRILDSLSQVKDRLLYLALGDLPLGGPPDASVINLNWLALGSIFALAIASEAQHLRIISREDGTRAIWTCNGFPCAQSPMSQDRSHQVLQAILDILHETNEKGAEGLPFIRVNQTGRLYRMPLDYRSTSENRFSLDVPILPEG